MAEKILSTRIALKIDTLENWKKSTLPLKKGELALATVAAEAGTGLTEPVVMLKVGEDGVKTFSQLDWNVYAKAADVLAACKSEDALKTFVNGVIADAGIASSDAMEALAGRVTTVEGEITTLKGDENTAGSVAKAIKDAIDALDLDNTYAAKTHNHTVSDITDFDASVKAYGYATTTELGNVDAKFADYVKSSDYATDKTATDNALADRYTKSEADGKFALITDAYDDTELAGRVKAIEDDYLVETDKTELSGLITAEKERAEGIEGGLRTDVDAIKADYLKASDKTELQNQINLIMNNPDTADVIDSITEFTQYIEDHGEIAEGFRTDIDKNKEDIAANAKAIADQATSDAATYETKTDASSKLGEAKTYANGLNTAMDTRVKALEAIEHDAYVAADEEVLADAKEYADGLNTAMNTRVESLEAIDHDHSNKTVLDGITAEKVSAWDNAQANAEATAAGALAAARTEISAEIDADVKVVNDALEAYKTSNNAEVAKKANDADLKAVAKSGLIDDLSIGEGTVLIFDCGDSNV